MNRDLLVSGEPRVLQELRIDKCAAIGIWVDPRK